MLEVVILLASLFGLLFMERLVSICESDGFVIHYNTMWIRRNEFALRNPPSIPVLVSSGVKGVDLREYRGNGVSQAVLSNISGSVRSVRSVQSVHPVQSVRSVYPTQSTHADHPAPEMQYIRRTRTYRYGRYDPKNQPPRPAIMTVEPPEEPLLLPDRAFYYDRDKHSLNQFGMFEKNQYDYEEIQYPIPFNRLYNDQKERYRAFGEAVHGIPAFVGTGWITPSKSTNGILLMTGASSSHFLVSKACFLSLALADKESSLVYIDFGLSAKEVESVGELFDLIHSYHIRHHSKSSLYYRVFDFSHFPSWMEMKNAHDYGGYAWKAIANIDALYEWKAYVGWVDAGSIIEKGIDREIAAARAEGMYSPESENTLHYWVYPKTIEFMEGTGMVGHVVLYKGMCSGGHFFMNYNNETIRNLVFMPYYQCAYTKRCITPNGSSRDNHRQDQAVLSVLAQEAHLRYTSNPDSRYIAKIHVDDRGNHAINGLIGQMKKRIRRK